MRGTTAASTFWTLAFITVLGGACSNNASSDTRDAATGGANSPTSGLAGAAPTDANGSAPELDAKASGTGSGDGAQAASVHSEAKQVMQLFVEDDPTLNLSQNAIENAENVKGRLIQTLALAMTATPMLARGCRRDRGTHMVEFHADQ